VARVEGYEAPQDEGGDRLRARSCALCGQSEDQVHLLVAGVGAAICDGCVAVCQDWIAEHELSGDVIGGERLLRCRVCGEPSVESAFLDIPDRGRLCLRCVGAVDRMLAGTDRPRARAHSGPAPAVPERVLRGRVIDADLPARAPRPPSPPLPPPGLFLPPGLWHELVKTYASPPRAYHTIDHVAELVDHFHAVRETHGWDRPIEIFLAILYHDAIYGAGHSDNEEHSARLARDEIARWLRGVRVDPGRVAHFIHLTARHGQLTRRDVNRDEAHFLDSDMAILGAEPEVFDRYEQQIEGEFAAVYPRPRYRAGRRRFLERLLASDHIYLSEHFRVPLEKRARANIERAIAALE